MSDRPQRIFLVGPSGSGKSIVARLAARVLGWQALDTDTLVEEATGLPVPEVFSRFGEGRFRDLESEALLHACRTAPAVVATGGGVLLRAVNRVAMFDSGLVVYLDARPETLLQRLGRGGLAHRPLLQGPDPLARISALKAQREAYYRLADCTIDTDGLSPRQVAEAVVRAWQSLPTTALGDRERVWRAATEPAPQWPGAACAVRTAGGSYPVFVEWGCLERLGELVAGLGLSGRAFLVSDQTVFAHHGEGALASLRAAGLQAVARAVPPGEATKTLDTAASLYAWLADQRAERREAIVALGGGMVTDLAGFVAATYARGLPLVHVPTSLLAMVDAAIGGKVAVNLPQAKNMVGAFYQPRAVVCDVAVLRTLPPRELRSGWAEAIKHALIADGELLERFESQAEALLALDPEAATEVIARSIAIKAHIVGEDEREERGLRTVLNYGHTLGHALESATDYASFLHGEAVAVGMTAAAEIGRRSGVTPPQLVARQRRLLERFGLPTRAPGVPLAAVRGAMALDKKVRGGSLRWVLLEDVGRPVVRGDVPLAVVEEVLSSLLGER
jgi:shikimate kinase/3-dehydroquinate synthase